MPNATFPFVLAKGLSLTPPGAFNQIKTKFTEIKTFRLKPAPQTPLVPGANIERPRRKLIKHDMHHTHALRPSPAQSWLLT